jgi:hypothetical protein
VLSWTGNRPVKRFQCIAQTGLRTRAVSLTCWSE